MLLAEDFMIPCLNKKLLGFECLGCGGQRALSLLFHGEFVAAFKIYPAIYTLILFALFIFGGEMIKGFSLALILGVLVGTYSSIYVVANMLMSLTLTQEDLAIPEPEGAEFDELP